MAKGAAKVAQQAQRTSAVFYDFKHGNYPPGRTQEEKAWCEIVGSPPHLPTLPLSLLPLVFLIAGRNWETRKQRADGREGEGGKDAVTVSMCRSTKRRRSERNKRIAAATKLEVQCSSAADDGLEGVKWRFKATEEVA